MAKWLTRLRWYTGTFAFPEGTHRGHLSFGNRWTIIHWPAVWRLHEFFVVGHCVISQQAWLEKLVYNRTRLSLLAFSLLNKELTISYVVTSNNSGGIRQPTGQRSNVEIIIGWELEAGRFSALRLWIHQDLLNKPLRQRLLSDGISKDTYTSETQ